MGSGFSLPNMNIKTRLKDIASCNSNCCNKENVSESYGLCNKCGSKITLSNLKYSDYDYLRHDTIRKSKRSS